MKLLLAFATIVAVSQAMSVPDLGLEEWEMFKIEHEKSYSSDTEEEFRMMIFTDSKKKIADHNARFEKGLVTFELGINKFSDRLPYELTHLYGLNPTVGETLLGNNENISSTMFVGPDNVELPGSIDWRRLGAVTRVKDQGQCGSCWAFSAIGSLEGQNFRRTGRLTELSEQNLVDCSTRNGGCNGGNMNVAFEYIRDNRGVSTESSYPYKATAGSCRYNAAYRGATVSGYVNIPNGDESRLMAAIASTGPVAIGIEVSFEFFSYRSGVYFEPRCANKLNHGVLAVGYGSDSGSDYWLVKNSWGPGWGDKGYIKMARNRGNNCAIASMASYPRV